MMDMPIRGRRLVYGFLLLLVAASPIALLAGVTMGSGDTSSPAPPLWLIVLLVTLGLAVLWASVTTLRRPRRFLLLMEGLVTAALVVVVVSTLWFLAAVAIRSESMTSGGPGLSISAVGVLSVEVDTRTVLGSREDDRYEKEFLVKRFGPGAAFLQSSVVSVDVDRPSAAARVIAIVNEVTLHAVVIGVLWLLRLVFARSARGEPFSMQNALALRWIAGLLVVNWFRSTFLERAGQIEAIHSNGGSAEGVFGFQLWGLLAAVLVLALSEVWRYGVELQQEAEATV